MVKKGEYSISNIYQGGVSSFEPDYLKGMTAESLGVTTDPGNANILQEVSTKLSTGIKHIEIELVSPDMLDSIAKQQFEEVKRLKELTGIDVSVHGPVIDTTGISQQGFSELNREESERKILKTIESSHELDPKGNIMVNFHSSESLPGTMWKTLGEDGKEREAKRMIVVNKESGQLTKLEEERMYYPGEREVPLKEGELKAPEWRIKNLNATEWDNSLSQIIFNKERADEILQQNEVQIRHILQDKELAKKIGKYGFDILTPPQKNAYKHYENAENYLQDVSLQVKSLFSKAYKNGNKKQKEILTHLSSQFQKDLDKSPIDPMVQSDALHKLMNAMRDPRLRLAPEMYVPVEQFATEQASKTFGNAAFESWEKFKGNAPIINIENPPSGFALSTGEDLRNLVKESRNKFVERAITEGYSKKQAKKEAEKLIGATWDVGHINMLRKQGFEAKDIIKETEKVAPFVKHVHLSDNIGFEHTELPMGMGNVPLKEIMKRLGKEGFEAKKIIEAASWGKAFKNFAPVQETMEMMGSPIYKDGVGPFWNQAAGLSQGYYAGLAGNWLPNINYQTFGTGFAQLPAELGGQTPGAQGSRMSGKPME